MKRREFNLGIAALRNAFPAGSDRITAEAEEIYWQELQRVPQDIWEQGIRKCITSHSAEYSFFPGVYDIGVACFGEQKEGTVIKCDPWRTVQFYKERVEEITWQQKMKIVLDREEQKQLLAPEVKKLAADLAEKFKMGVKQRK